MITAQIEQLTRSSVQEIEQLVNSHGDEVSAHVANGIPVNCNWSEYINRQFADQLIYITLRQDAKLIGYFSAFIVPCLHYQALTLTLDAIYVTPDLRNADGGTMLMEIMEKEFKRRGAKVWRMGYKVQHAKFMEKLLAKFGFEDFEIHKIRWSKD